MNCKICESADTVLVQDTVRDGSGRVSCDVLKCNECGTVFLGAKRSQQELNDYFTKDYWKSFTSTCDPEVYYKRRIEMQRQRYERLKDCFRLGDRVLEVGCASGAFLDVVKDKVASAEGVEPFMDYAQYARDKLGLKVTQGTIDDLPDSPEYDVICLFQMLEHLEDPKEFMRKVHARLKPGGVVILENQNADDPLVSVFNVKGYKDFFYVLPNLFYFTEKSMKGMLESTGFRDVGFRSFQHYSFTNNLSWVYTGRPSGDDKGAAAEAMLPNADALKEWLRKINKEYKELLESRDLMDTILCVARK